MTGTGNPDVEPGDRIRITRISHADDEHGLRVGAEHDVEHVGHAQSGTVYITLAGCPVALVSDLGDEWALA